MAHVHVVGQAAGGHQKVTMQDVIVGTVRFPYGLHQIVNVVALQRPRCEENRLPPTRVVKVPFDQFVHVAPPGQITSRQVLLEGEVHEAELVQTSLNQQPALLADQLHEVVGQLPRLFGRPPLPFLEVGGDALFQFLPPHQAAWLLGVHPEGDGSQELHHEALVQPPLSQPEINGPSREAAGQVPGLGQCLHAQPVKLHPPVGKPRSLVMDEGQDGDEQRVDRQSLDGLLAGDGCYQALRSLSGPPLRLRGRLGNSHPLVGIAPLVGEVLHLLVAKGEDGEVGEVIAQKAGAIASDAAGDHVAVAWIAAHQIPHPPDHLQAHLLPYHLVQAIQEQETAASLQLPGEQGREVGQAALGEVAR